MYTHYARGDDRPVIHDQLTRGRTPIPLGADDTVHLYVEDPEGEIFIADQATVVDRPESHVEYEMNGGWPLAGTYEAEWVIEYADGGTRTVPSGSPKEIPVREILNRTADIRNYDDPDISVSNVWTNHIGVNTAQAVTVGSPLEFGGNNVTGIGQLDAQSANMVSASINGETAATRPWVENADHVTSGDWTFNGLTKLPYLYGEDISTGTDAEWFKIASLSGGGANCKVLMTETSRTGNPHESGVEFCSFKNGNDVHEHGGWWYQLTREHGRILEGDFGFVDQSDDTTGNIKMDVYYKAAPFTRSSCIVLEGDGVNYDFQNVGATEPAGIEYLESVFPIASKLELANGISTNLDVDGNITSNNGIVNLGTNGAQIFENSNGEIIVEDTAGNRTTLTN